MSGNELSVRADSGMLCVPTALSTKPAVISLALPFMYTMPYMTRLALVYGGVYKEWGEAYHGRDPDAA
jgi:hypothetical protein